VIAGIAVACAGAVLQQYLVEKFFMTWDEALDRRSVALSLAFCFALLPLSFVAVWSEPDQAARSRWWLALVEGTALWIFGFLGLAIALYVAAPGWVLARVASRAGRAHVRRSGDLRRPHQGTHGGRAHELHGVRHLRGPLVFHGPLETGLSVTAVAFMVLAVTVLRRPSQVSK
jgi:hypothetical protein